MSRLGKKPIAIKDKTEVTVADDLVTVKGPLGQLQLRFNRDIGIKVENGQVILTQNKKTLETDALWGTYSSLIQNMMEGVNKEFEKKLIIEGVGYRIEVRGQKLVFSVGLSHPIEMEIPKGIKVTVEGENISVKGIDKELVGQFAANIRATKKPEPYLGKGIRYGGEVIRRKQGKKTV
ncbi:MAG TPA: 50S ribosomal protein L6 [Candidatus Paceibacterota bacterium]|nr:50S ribosomal protein L6 [Candidatus Paceibacterota bacterium]HRZ34303.1 50S ribosomal protein L6 [Candidatus Paceibacterota bacterium]